MDLILYNGQIFSMESSESIYSAIAMKDGTIKHIGTDDEVLGKRTNETILVDLDKKYVFPGFNDSHMHLMGYGAALFQVDLTSAKSIDDIIKITKKFILDNNINEASWVVGRGWNQDYFDVKEIPNYSDLDKISASHKVFLRRACGHVGTVNSAVLDELKLSHNFTQIDGGEYENGIFKENALDLITSSVPDPTIEEMKCWIKAGVDSLLSLGITSVQSDDLCVLSPLLSKDIFTAFNELEASKELNIRVYEQSLFRTKENFEEFIKDGYSQNHGSSLFKLGPLKILGDGSLGGRTAYLRKPYNDDETSTGISMYTQDELNDYVLSAQKNNISVAIHCIGDRMLESAIDSIKYASAKYPNMSLRHGIVHCQLTSLEQLKTMSDLNILAYVQPIFLDYDMHIIYDRVGDELASTSYNWKTMMDLDIRISFGSDAPVETPDPIKGMHCANKRNDLKSTVKNGYLKEQSISVYDCIYNYTVEGAYASYEEDIKGKLLPNYLADLVVVSGDIFSNTLSSKVEMTILNGVIAYKNATD